MIELNYDDGEDEYVNCIDFSLEESVITTTDTVLFVGEGDFTFTVAFTALRASKSNRTSDEVWKGIVATCYDSEYVKPPAALSEVKLNCIESAKNYSKDDPADIIEKIEHLKPSKFRKWQYGIDACT